MNSVALEQVIADASRTQKLVRQLHRCGGMLEDALLASALVAMVALPIVEIILRATFAVGIENVSALVQHLTLIVGTLGAAIAAREKRLLAFAGVDFLAARMRTYGRAVSSAVSISVCALLAYGSLKFVEAERLGSLILAYGIPVWIVELCIPVAFFLIGLRLLDSAARGAAGVIGLLLGAGVLIVSALIFPFSVEAFRYGALGLLLLAALLGAPVFVAVGGAALILQWSEGIPLASLAVDHYSLVSNSMLPAIPLFTLAGYFLAESDAPKRLVELFDAWFGRIRGGTALASVLACTFFTSITGASGVTILALGGLLMPLLMTAGYSKSSALGLVTGGGSAGVLLRPALPLILYAIIAKVSIEEMFLGGIGPAVLMISIAAYWGMLKQPRTEAKTTAPFDLNRALHSIWIAKWELLLPVVLFAGMFSGLMTPMEASAVTALYAFFIEVVVHRDLSLRRDVPRVLVQCGLLIGGILLILGVALGLTNYIVDAQISDRLVDWVTGSIDSRWIFLILLNVILLIAGFFIDIYSAIVVIAPLIVPIGAAFGVDPIHLGIIFLANMELGYLTPPVGMNLFFASSRFERPILEICRAVVPLFGLFTIGVLIITFVPWLSTALPGLLR